MKNLFIDHPASVNETYFQHMFAALGFCGRFALGALVALIHAFLPFLFCRTGSRIIADLHQNMVTHRQRHGKAVTKVVNGLGQN